MNLPIRCLDGFTLGNCGCTAFYFHSEPSFTNYLKSLRELSFILSA